MSGQDKQRDVWSNQCEFFVSSLGLAVGLGNIWRFPYVCYQNGGGTFLIPYIIMLLFVGIPALLFEQSVGQYAREGVNKIFGQMVPLFQGLGYTIVVIAILNQMYYAIVCGWGFFYMFAGFQKELPWIYCDDGESWHTPDCYTKDLGDQCRNTSNVLSTWYNGSCVDMTSYCTSHGFDDGKDVNTTVKQVDFNCTKTGESDVRIQDVIAQYAITPAEDYFNGFVLGYTKGSSGEAHSWYDFGKLQWQPALCMLLTWFVMLMILFKGLKVYGKIAYFMTLLPYFVLTAFLIYGLTLQGSKEGIDYFITPVWDKMAKIDVWYRAASQILFSLSLGYGSQFALCSYSNFKNITIRDAILIGICNSATSIYAGFVVFAILGFLAKETGVPVEEVVNDGIILSFVSYPSAMAYMDVPQLWAFLFFFMLVNLAFSSGCANIQCIATYFMDEWPSLRKSKMLVFTCVAAILFLWGLPMCCEGGILLFTLYDQRISSSLLFVVWVEIMVVIVFYGINKFIDNLQEMGMNWGLSSPCGPLRIVLIISLRMITPGVLIAVAVIGWIKREPISYGGENFPDVVEGFGWLLELGPLIFLPLFAIRNIYKLREHPAKEILKKLTNPAPSWYEADRLGAKEHEIDFGHDNMAYSPTSEERLQSYRELYDRL